jgi:formate hydrogenlyase subunit 4
VAWGVLGPLLLLAFAPLGDGVARRVRARLQSRVGPPLLQGYWDLAKLAGKHDRGAARGPLAAAAPIVAVAAATTAALLVPSGGHAPLGFAGDLVAFVYLLGFATVAMVLGGAAGGGAYAFLGANRELLLVLFAEPAAALALFALAMRAHSFRLAELTAFQGAHGPGLSGLMATAALLLSLLAWTGRQPFDLSEAEQELTGGLLVEYGGPRLAMFRWALQLRLVAVAWLAGELLVPVALPFAAGLVVALARTLVLIGVASAAETLLARLRLREARLYLANVATLAALAIAFALIGS